MKSFIVRLSFVSAPLLFLFIYTSFSYSYKDGGDLNRIGFIDAKADYRTQFEEVYKQELRFKRFTKVMKEDKKVFSTLIVGDSYLREKQASFPQHLDKKYTDKGVVYFNAREKNVITSLNAILNGDLLEHYQFDFIILQSAEREAVNRLETFDSTKIFRYEELTEKNFSEFVLPTLNFPPIYMIKYPLYQFLYNFDDNAYLSKVYKLNLEKAAFSSHQPKQLLFYYQDLRYLPKNNDPQKVKALDQLYAKMAQKTAKKGIPLIVMNCPDKFSFHREHLTNKEDYPEPIFWQHMLKEPKNYNYLDCWSLLKKEAEQKTDIYYYEDSHWSPVGAKIVGKQLSVMMNELEN